MIFEEYQFSDQKHLPRRGESLGFSIALDAEHVDQFEAVSAVSRGVRINNILVDHLEVAALVIERLYKQRKNIILYTNNLRVKSLLAASKTTHHHSRDQR